MRDRFFFLFILFGLLFTSQAYALIDTNLVAYYKFDETSGTVLTDWVGLDHNFANSSATINQTGKIDKAYLFSAGAVTRTNFYNNMQTRTINIWINPANNNKGKIYTSLNSAEAIDIWRGTDKKIYVQTRNSGKSWVNEVVSSTIEPSVWTMLTVTFNSATKDINLYLNGTYNASGNWDTISNPGETIVYIGGYFQNFSGLIDETGFWSRLLTNEEITELYNSGSGLTYPFPTQGINVDFNYEIRKDLNKILLTDTSIVNGVTKSAWTWTSNGSTVSTAQDYNLTATELTDYNICLHVDTNVADVNGDKCYSFNTGDWTPPVTTFTSSQYENETKQKLTFVCTDNNSGCKYLNYIIDNNVWIQVANTGTIDINYSGAGSHSIQYFSTDNSDNNETIKTSNFTTYGMGRFYFKDENSGSDLTGVSINFNGIDYNSGENNYIDFNFQTLSSTNNTYLFTITKDNYSTRYYQTDLNYFSDFNVTFALIPESLATNIQFKMFPPTGTSVLANTYIEFKDKDTNYTITRLKSNENGELTAKLHSDDQNYLVWISEGTYIYQAVKLTILYPKDEQTLSDITGNWRIEITDNISYQDLNIPQGTNKIIYLLPNTKYPFTIAVQDVAGTYFKRKWSKIYQGNPITDTLQPYLVNADDGIAVKFVFQDPKRDSIENIIINIYKNVGGIKTLISSGASDVTGNALFFLIAGDKYALDFSYDGTIIFETQNYAVTSSTVYWTINLATKEIKTVDGTFITIGFNPIQDYILKNATNISYKVTASGLNRTRAEFYIIQDGNKIITYTRDAPCTTPCTVTIPIEDLNITLGNKVYLDLNVYIDSNNYIFNYQKTWSYGTTSNIDTHDLFVKARIDFGCTTDTMWPCPLTSIVSIIIMILLIGSMVFTFNFVNPKGLLVAGLGILAVFTYLGWFWWVALVLIIIASIFYLRGD